MLSVIFYLILVAFCYLYDYPSPENKFFVIVIIGLIILIFHLSRCSRRLFMIYEKMPEYEDDDGDDDGTKEIPPLNDEPLEVSGDVVNSEEKEVGKEEIKNKAA